MPWFRGNVHTHTDHSDGDSPLEDVVAAYRDMDYDFLVITDHNVVTRIPDFTGERPLLIPGCEITLSAQSVPVHLNAIGVTQISIPTPLHSIAATMQAAIDSGLAAGGIVQINHPNFCWAFGADELLKSRGAHMMEIYNAHPMCNNHGGGGVPSPESMWDQLLTAGVNIWGSASDDMHQLRYRSPAQWADLAMPGRAWVSVRAETLTHESVIASLKGGEFIASTGVGVTDIETGDGAYRFTIVPRRDWLRFTTTFVGAGGRTLATDHTFRPAYQFSGDEGYVRAKVTASDGTYAWAQPCWISR